jgi:inhibitor of cysteine peptidase
MLRLALAVALIGLNSAGSTLIITTKDSGHELRVSPGQVLQIRLPSNRTTGYSWSLANPSSAVLKPRGTPTYERKTSTAGAGGTELWEFVAVQGGHQTLHFEYRRQWEKSTKPAKTISFSVLVR